MKPSKNFLIVMATAVLLLWSASASAQDVKYNFMPGTDFSKYKTYKWVRVPKVEYPNQILDVQIMQSIDAQLAMKGLSKTEGDNPDLYVAYQAAVRQEQQWNSYSTDMGGAGWGYGRWGGWGGYGGGMSSTTTTSSTINIGTINLDMYDVAAKNQVWRGAASKTLGSGKDPKKVQKNLDKAMAKMLKNYPPPVKK
jgi:predicted heme/steroid binding protein